MAHHSGRPDSDAIRKLFERSGSGEPFDAERELRASRPKLGATGQFPEGRIDGTDEGEILMGVAADATRGKVIVNFGKAVVWVGMTPDQAEALAESLQHRAAEARRGLQSQGLM